MVNLSPDELSRYNRQILLGEIGLTGQQRLRAARVLVIGAGGLGSPAALYLAAAGVGTLGLADFDRVEGHNLQRQILHDTAAIGTAKTASAVRRLRALNPQVAVVPHPEGVTVANAREMFSHYDVIVDGTDNFPARYLNNDAAVLARRPLVFGSVYKFSGQVSVFAPAGGGPCYRCLFPAPPPPEAVPGCGDVGVLGALCGVIGSLQALEAIKLVVGFGDPLIGRLLTYDALTQTFRNLVVPRNPGCALCGDPPRIDTLRPENYDFSCAPSPAPPLPPDCPREISVEEVSRLLAGRPGEILLVDVREPHETAICHIAGARPIPMRQIPERLVDLPRDKHLLICCHHGGRSQRVADYLRGQGFARVSNVAGGIAAWAGRIDPAMRQY